MNNETGQRLTEAIWALTNELRKQADKGPSHTGAAPFTSGETVTVTNPRSEWLGSSGMVLAIDGNEALVYVGDHGRYFQTRHLEKADDK